MSEFLTFLEIQELPSKTQVLIAWVGESTYSRYWIARRNNGEIWTICRSKWMRHIEEVGTKLWEIRIKKIENPEPFDWPFEPDGIEYNHTAPPPKRLPKSRKYVRTKGKRKTPSVAQFLKKTDLSKERFSTTQNKPLPKYRWHIVRGGSTAYCWEQLVKKQIKPFVLLSQEQRKKICRVCLVTFHRTQKDKPK